jgi:regulator of sirC expression with transglutaminase-like and TPR domain
VNNTEAFRAIVENITEDLPLDRAVALIAGIANESVSPAEILNKFDEMGVVCDSKSVLGVMRFLFGPGKFAGNTVNFQDPANSLFDSVLSRKLGIPISLSVLAIEVAKRKDFELLPIGMPGNFLVQSGNDDDQYFDPFRGPDPLSSQACVDLFLNLNPQALWSDSYLQPVTNRAVIIRMLTNLKMFYIQTNNTVGLRWVMRLRLMFQEVAVSEKDQWARLMRSTN